MRARSLLLLGAALLLVAPAGMAGAMPGAAPARTMPPGDVIRVRGVAGDTVLALVASAGGGLVQVDALARLLGGSLEETGAGRWRMTLYNTTIDLSEGSPFAGFNGFALPLSEPTRVLDGHAHASLQLFSEIIPRFGIGILWDKSRWEVRLFQAIARRAAPPAPRDALGNAVLSNASETRGAEETRAATATHESAPAAARAPVPAASRVTAPAASPAPASKLSRRYKVVVDPGHGGVDPGNAGTLVNGRRLREAQIALAISLKVERELKQRGIDVYMTRRTDTLIALGDRGRIANRQKADLFVSIHTNAANPGWKNASSARGFETYFLSAARTEDERRVAAMENEVVRFESSVEAKAGDPLSFILNDIAQNEHLRESSDLAATVQKSLAGAHPGPSRGVKQAPFAVLAGSYMPAVLIEVGFGSNRDDTAFMVSAAGQQKTAEAIADATFEYLLHYERRVKLSQR
ncbi:MAG TPA: N-acetylmuramoyl-L-alanine amidase [Gemmatimonadaceae bacterium]|nr:N-acetylmuramoyl-L-alanine amidase [Gemmatimonadaceae bacterium]